MMEFKKLTELIELNQIEFYERELAKEARLRKANENLDSNIDKLWGKADKNLDELKKNGL